MGYWENAAEKSGLVGGFVAEYRRAPQKRSKNCSALLSLAADYSFEADSFGRTSTRA